MSVFFIVTFVLSLRSWGRLALVSVPKPLVTLPLWDGHTFDRFVEMRHALLALAVVPVAIQALLKR
jgi:hypothetical protein